MKIKCVNPLHDDDTPSMEVYENRAYCFSCGYSVPSEEVADFAPEKKQKTDISSIIRYIETLPLLPVRGLYLPSDGRGYYIVWPDKSYYKKRLFDGTVRYIAPTGQKPPLYLFSNSKTSLVIVEGELNALTLQTIGVTPASIASPGSANDLAKHMDKYLTYSNIAIIVDKDAAGVANGLTLKNKLLKQQKKVQLVASEKDANQIFQEKGHKGLKAWFQDNLDMPKRV